MKKIVIKPGCISCGACAFLVPEVFEVTDTAQVKDDVDLHKYEERIKQAMQQCPVRVIEYQQ